MLRRVPSIVLTAALVATVFLGPATPVATGATMAGGLALDAATAGGTSGLGVALIAVGLVLCAIGFAVAFVVIQRAGNAGPRPPAGVGMPEPPSAEPPSAEPPSAEPSPSSPTEPEVKA